MEAGQSPVLLEIRDVAQDYPLPRESLLRPPGVVQALRGVSLDVVAGRSMGIVGESGSGKSTLGRLVMALERPTRGSIRFEGRDLAALSPAGLRAARRDFQMVFQDPYGSLDPRQPVWRTVAEPLAALENAGRAQQRARAAETLASVGMDADVLDKYPHEFSGGQRQRIGIARALMFKPRLLVADESVSALDVSIQAQIIELLKDLKRQHGLSYLFIAHDLPVVRDFADRTIVMQSGQVVESGRTQDVFERPQHPYTQNLLASRPKEERHRGRALETLK